LDSNIRTNTGSYTLFMFADYKSNRNFEEPEQSPPVFPFTSSTSRGKKHALVYARWLLRTLPARSTHKQAALCT